MKHTNYIFIITDKKWIYKMARNQKKSKEKRKKDRKATTCSMLNYKMLIERKEKYPIAYSLYNEIQKKDGDYFSWLESLSEEQLKSFTENPNNPELILLSNLLLHKDNIRTTEKNLYNACNALLMDLGGITLCNKGLLDAYTEENPDKWWYSIDWKIVKEVKEDIEKMTPEDFYKIFGRQKSEIAIDEI